MLWLWILLLLLAVLVLLPLVIGMLLRDDYVGLIRVEFDVPPQRVWDELQDHERHPLSGNMAKAVLGLESDNGLPSWVEDLGSTQLEVRTEVSDAPSKLILNTRDRVVPMSARWEIELSPIADGCAVRVSNTTVIRSGTWHSPIFRLMMRTTGAAEKILREYLREVAGELGVTARLVDPSELTGR
jgi:hypothetical protein